jgi:hypothetical protein
LFKLITGKLAALNYLIWDSRLLSVPRVDRWISNDGYVDCGGFLLPIGADVGSVTLDEQRLEAGNLIIRVKPALKQGLSIRGLSISTDAGSPVQYIEVTDAADSAGDLTVKMPIDRLMKNAAAKSDDEKLAELSRMNMTVLARTSDNHAIFLQGR